MNTLAYKLMKRIIERAIADHTLPEKRAGIMDKLDAYLAGDRITSLEYAELVAMMGGGENE